MSSIGQGSISIDESTRIGENAQDTANEVAGNVNDINSDNKLTPSEKIKLKQEYDKDLKLYTIDTSQLQSADLPTTELETAMNNLTAFITPLFKEMNRTSTVDRGALDSVFTAFATADKNASQAFVNKVQQVADDAKKAGDDAKQAGEEAQELGQEAKKSAEQAQTDATQAKADASTAQQKAQSSIDQLNEATKKFDGDISDAKTSAEQAQSSANNALSSASSAVAQASSAAEDSKDAKQIAGAVSQSYKTLTDGSTMTIAELQSGLAAKLTKTDLNGYATQDWAQNKIKMTADGINGTISSVKSTVDGHTTSINDLKADSSGFKSQFTKVNNTLGKQTTDIGTLQASSTEVSSTLETVQTQVQNSAVGTNLLTGTSNTQDYTMSGSGWVVGSQSSNGTTISIPATPGKSYTYSTIVKSTTFDCYPEIQFFDSGKNHILTSVNVPGKDIGMRKTTAIAPENTAFVMAHMVLLHPLDSQTVVFNSEKLEKGAIATDWCPNPADTATSTEIDQINNAISLKANSSDVTSQITESINNINLKVANANGSSSQVNINDNTILLDANKIIFSGNTSILDGTIGTAKIANAAINTAQIANGAINNAKIANAAIDDAKISNLDGNKIIAGSITASQINVDDLIANGINTKTLTAVNLNASTLITPELDLGFNGTFTEDFDYTQPTSMFLPKKNKGTLTFNHGVLQSKGRMQTYVNNTWGGMNDNYTFQAGIDNSQWTEVGPGYIKQDLFKQNNADVAERTYIDPTGYYYTSRNGTASYLGNVLQTSQVQAPSVFAKYIGPSNGELRLQIGSNGSHYGLQVGSYAGNEAVLSDFIYNSTTSGAANVNITSNGHLVRSTSASKYKYNIKNPDIETTLGDRLLNVHLATWNDKRAVDSYAEQLNTGEEREKSSIDKYYGLIAEQLRDAGLDMFISYGKNHEIEGIQYDRAWIPLLSVIRRLNDKVNEYELRLSKLEGANK
ncbi:hypothetical protein [Pediococcus pentosaceus]|uniref:hypothetical protein n=1 Tax=Pediococcus pentosaceus TaxID=1255 RepID=UPI000762966B|nr:hypothetical protein [Pediococcus pentosaceus]NEZ68495.1 hypothetical protein [Pediococcus pentosaceus]